MLAGTRRLAHAFQWVSCLVAGKYLLIQVLEDLDSNWKKKRKKERNGVPAERASPRGPKNQTSPMSRPHPIAIFFQASFLLGRPGPMPPSRRS